jgi:cell division septation protein DedD
MTDHYPGTDQPAARPRRRNALGVAIIVGAVMLLACIFLTCVGIVTGDSNDRGQRPTTTTTTPAPAPAARAAKVASDATPKPLPAPKVVTPKVVTYVKLTAREWKRVAKNPDAYQGRTYVVHGVVTQFDAATGPQTFRASVDGVRHSGAYEYETNVVINQRKADLDDLVQGDEFTASIEVMGGLTYDTAIGGSTTVPELVVDKIKRH